jgi:hypothetical protein
MTLKDGSSILSNASSSSSSTALSSATASSALWGLASPPANLCCEGRCSARQVRVPQVMVFVVTAQPTLLVNLKLWTDQQVPLSLKIMMPVSIFETSMLLRMLTVNSTAILQCTRSLWMSFQHGSSICQLPNRQMLGLVAIILCAERCCQLNSTSFWMK